MNRRQRRAALRRILSGAASDERIPVFGPDDRIVALVPKEQVRWYRAAPNARLVTRRDGQVVRIQLRALGDDTSLITPPKNPRRYSHDHETTENPPLVWTLRRLAQHDTAADRFVRAIYRASVLDNLKERAA